MKLIDLHESGDNDLDISITGDWKVRIFVTAKIKPAKRTWLDTDRDVVDATYDITDSGKCLYRNYIRVGKKGKGYARAVHEYIFAQAKKHGMERTEGYIENANFDAKSMVKKLGMHEIRQTKHGSYWGKNL